jgi:hypothetical protein
MLVDDGLVTRYFVDEAAQGSEPAALLDRGEPALDLPVEYAGIAEFVELSGNRGLLFSEISADARASVEASGSKIEDALADSTTGTIEMVVDIADARTFGSCLSHVGESSGSGLFSVRAHGTSALSFRLNNSAVAFYEVDFSGRSVLHLVFDSRASRADRARLFVNGERIEPSETPDISDGERIRLPEQSFYYSIGNRESGDRGVHGTFFYTALYSTALDEDSIVNNTAVLGAADDAPRQP